MSANFQITCEQQRTALSVPERLANICLISEMTDLTVQTNQGTPPLFSLSISLSLPAPWTVLSPHANSAADQGHFAAQRIRFKAMETASNEGGEREEVWLSVCVGCAVCLALILIEFATIFDLAA